MKSSIIFKITLVLLLVSMGQLLYSQCEVDYMSPDYHNFSSSGGSVYIYVYTYPDNCEASLSYPEWLSVDIQDPQTYVIYCSQNTGGPRYDYVYIGENDFVTIEQDGAPLDPGAIRGPSGQTSMTICYNSAPGTLINYTSAGPESWNPSYQWQVSTNGSSFSDISGATSSEYAPGNLTATRYYRRQASASGATTVYSNTITVTVRNALSGGVVGGTDYICYNADAGYVTNEGNASGGSGSFTYSWEYSTNGGSSWTPVALNETSYYAGELTTTTQYKRKVTDNTCGNSAYAAYTVVKTIYDQLDGGIISGAQTICYNEDASNISSTENGTGGSLSYTISWEKSENGGSSWSSAGEGYWYFDPSNLTTTTIFRRKITDNYGCGSVYSNTITKTVRNQLSGGSISGTQSICYNIDAATLNNSVLPSGGTESFSYQWQYSINGGSSWNDVSGATSSSYDPSYLTATTIYRRKSTDNGGCGYVYSNEITVTVYSQLSPGVISGEETICYDADAANISSTSDAGGGSGSYTYYWEKSTNGGSSWTDAGGSSATFDPSNLTITTQYRRKVTDNTCSTNDYSNTIIKTVRPDLNGGTIAGSQTLCYDEDAANITSSEGAGGGSESYTYYWEKSTDGGSNWTSAGGSSATFDPSNLTTTTQYRRKVTDNTCSNYTYSNTVTKTVNSPLTSGEIAGDQTINYNETPVTLTNESYPSGGDGQYSYQWKSSPNGESNWSVITGATNSTYTPGPLSSSKYFRRYVSDNSQCGTLYSNNVSISVRIFAVPDSTLNYIYIKEPNNPFDNITEITNIEDFRSNIQYFDGLGRALQNIQIAGSPGGNDIITPFQYDEFGRDTIKFLPFISAGNGGAFMAGATGAQRAFYDGSSYFPDDTANIKTVFELSPLNRILQQGAPGNEWQPYTTADTSSGHTIRYEYNSNEEHDVIYWKIVGNKLITGGGVTFQSRHYYPSGTLFKTTLMDENWSTSDTLHKSEEYKDLMGNVILKRSFVKNGVNVDKLETYYVYDDFNRLRYVLPPKAVANISSSMDTLINSDNIIRNLCYYYRYDGRSRLIIKQLPGADSVYLVYDKRDRLVLTQDGNNRISNKWLFTKYDNLNRPVLTGVLPFPSSKTQSEMQTIVDTLYSGSSPRSYGVSRNSSLTGSFGFTDESFPNNSDGTLVYLTGTYYDNYDFPEVRQFNNGANISDYEDDEENSKFFDYTGGLVTGSRVKILGTSTCITTTNYYDDHYRVIQSLKNLYDDANSSEISGNLYDFTGKVLQNRQRQTFNNVATTIDKFYTYDHTGRLLKTESSINQGDTLSIAEMTYNELGQISVKGLNYNGTSFLQEIDYGYNIHGWLANINDPDNLGSDLFSMKILYDSTSSLSELTRHNQYNGNIAGIIWNRKTDASNTLKSAYSFNYDALNRITSNYYGYGAPTLTNSDKFREYDYSYDLNGNLLSLKRNNASGNLMDNLAYSYRNSSLSNQLATVSDNSSNTNGFYDRNTSGNDYSYDSIGNLTKDLNKGINTIVYNLLNLPDTVKKDATHKVMYLYDAMGTKLQQITVDGNDTTGRYYSDGFEYSGDKALSLIHMDEGVIHDSSGVFRYDYFIKDHLGNTRIVARARTNNTPYLVQSDDYYPFGLSFSTNTTFSFNNKYLYNGKEFQDQQIDGVALDWYDYGARFYDPQIGIWTTIDPLAEERTWVTPYNFVQNNPLVRIDPDGTLDDWVERSDKKIEWDDKITSANDANLKKGETWLGKNVLVGNHNRDNNLNEPINSARFDLYLESDKSGPSATIYGNTVPSDVSKFGTMAEGLYSAEYGSRASYIQKGKEDLAIIINGGKDVPTVRGNPNKVNSDMLDGVFFHKGNPYQKSLRDATGNPVWSHGCQTSASGPGSLELHNAFMKEVGTDFKGSYYLRSQPQYRFISIPLLNMPTINFLWRRK